MIAKPPKPFLLSLTLYSLLVLQVVFLLGLVVLLFKYQQLDDLYHSYHTNDLVNPFGWFLYVIIFILLAKLYAIVQMLRQKICGAYIFHFFSLILLVYLFIASPIEWVNVVLVVLLNVIMIIYYPWFKDKAISQPEEDQSPIVVADKDQVLES